jgi:hypothetical protein
MSSVVRKSRFSRSAAAAGRARLSRARSRRRMGDEGKGIREKG